MPTRSGAPFHRTEAAAAERAAAAAAERAAAAAAERAAETAEAERKRAHELEMQEEKLASAEADRNAKVVDAQANRDHALRMQEGKLTAGKEENKAKRDHENTLRGAEATQVEVDRVRGLMRQQEQKDDEQGQNDDEQAGLGAQACFATLDEQYYTWVLFQFCISFWHAFLSACQEITLKDFIAAKVAEDYAWHGAIWDYFAYRVLTQVDSKTINVEIFLCGIIIRLVVSFIVWIRPRAFRLQPQKHHILRRMHLISAIVIVYIVDCRTWVVQDSETDCIRQLRADRGLSNPYDLAYVQEYAVKQFTDFTKEVQTTCHGWQDYYIGRDGQLIVLMLVACFLGIWQHI